MAMDRMEQENTHGRSKRLAVLAGAGMVVATGFATVAAVAVGTLQADESSNRPPVPSTDPPFTSTSSVHSSPLTTSSTTTTSTTTTTTSSTTSTRSETSSSPEGSDE